uniref:Uncharacterized protein n=1 Tax=Timema bartmani TaxID=61472 RepID=A0A7R9EMT2_9NEOP|nr:unnamed protein product [Timema bartmani]
MSDEDSTAGTSEDAEQIAGDPITGPVVTGDPSKSLKSDVKPNAAAEEIHEEKLETIEEESSEIKDNEEVEQIKEEELILLEL